MSATNRQMFRVLRYFSLTSLISIVVAAALLTLLYREVALREIQGFGERGNVVLTQSVLDAMRPELDAFLMDEEAHHGPPFPADLAATIERLTRDSSVRRIDVIDDEGIILFSTDAGLIEADRSGMAAYRTAIAGEVHSRFDYRDVFSLFTLSQQQANVVMSYVPIRNGSSRPVAGVLAVETDVTELLAEVERAQVIVFLGSIGVMALLYLVLLAIVRYAERVIRAQEATIRERSRALETLSAQLIMTQEEEKQRLAHELNEGIAQTLAGLKFRLEHAGVLLDKQGAGNPAISPLVELVKAAMQDVRSLAMDVRPPSLDELGVLATLKWYCKELRHVYPDLDLSCEASVEEADIPRPVRVVVYRVVQQLLQALVRELDARRVELLLGRTGGQLWLEVRADRDPDVNGASPEQLLQLAALRERVTLSGGSLAINPADGGALVRAEWPV